MTLEAIKFKNGKLEILDQLLLPNESKYICVNSKEDAFRTIKDMNVRGAPAIAIVAILSVAAELFEKKFSNVNELVDYVSSSLDYLVTSRPTAVNIAYEAQKVKDFCENLRQNVKNVDDFQKQLIAEMSTILDLDVATNRAIGKYGALHILQNQDAKRVNNSNFNILTHCNTGSLATGGYGTALGVIRYLRELGNLNHVYCTETRPYNQGSRLTAYELVYEKIPATLICDNMVGLLLQKKNISAIVTGADRVVANGDSANKIGTYQLAILAKYHNVPFYIAAPSTSIDLNKRTGDEIVIEERSPTEITHVKGKSIAAPGINCWNPAFDVAPAELITGGIITEFGVFKPEELEVELKKHLNLA